LNFLGVGDDSQIPPIKDKILYHEHPTSESLNHKEKIGEVIFSQINEIIILTQD
jgi:hypothetical protein